MQGDEYSIPFTITSGDITVTDATVDAVEIVIGHLRKSYPEDITYAAGEFLFPLTQEETMKLRGKQPAQVRVKFLDGMVLGVELEAIDVTESRSKVVL